MKGVLFNKDEKDLEKIKEAFRSYLAIFPSEQIAFNNFEEQVRVSVFVYLSNLMMNFSFIF